MRPSTTNRGYFLCYTVELIHMRTPHAAGNKGSIRTNKFTPKSSNALWFGHIKLYVMLCSRLTTVPTTGKDMHKLVLSGNRIGGVVAFARAMRNVITRRRFLEVGLCRFVLRLFASCSGHRGIQHCQTVRHVRPHGTPGAKFDNLPLTNRNTYRKLSGA